MLKTQEYPKEHWESCLNDLSREAKEHQLTVRVESPELGDQILTRGVPLLAIEVEKKGTEQGAIELIAERDDGTHLTHLIRNPEHIFVSRDEAKHAIYLDIEDKSGIKTLVFLHEGGY